MRTRHFTGALAMMLMASVPAVFSSCTEEATVSENSPEVTLTQGTSTESSITFLIDCKNADEAAYLVYPSEGDAPAATDIIQSGTRVDITATFRATASLLRPETSYTVYAVASKGDVLSEIATLEMSTTEEPPLEYDRELSARAARAYYFGETASTGVAEYTLNLTDAEGFTDQGGPLLNAQVYRFGLWTEIAADPENPGLPEGTYTFSDSGTPVVGTFDYNSSLYGIQGGNPSRMRSGSVVTITKSDNGYTIDATVITEDAFNGVLVHHVTYSGEVEVYLEEEEEVTPGQPTVSELNKDLLDIEFTSVSGFFYNNTDDGKQNIVLEFSNMGLDDEGLYEGPGQAMQLDLVTVIGEDNTIAEGTYYIPSGELYAYPGVFDGSTQPEGTYVTDIDEAGNFLIGALTGGTVTVTCNYDTYEYTFTFDLTTADSFRLTGTYTGPVSVSGLESSYQTTLTGDYEIQFGSGNANVNATYYGDWLSSKGNNWAVTLETLKDDGTYECMYAELIGDISGFEDGIPAGTYSVAENVDSPASFTFMPGLFDYGYAEYTRWCHMAALDGYSYIGCAPITGGTIEVSRDGDNYTFVFDMLDDAGHRVTGTWSGALSLINNDEQ